MARWLRLAMWCMLVSLLPGLARAVVATTDVVWQEEAERLSRGDFARNFEVVNDPDASNGQAVRIPLKDPVDGRHSWVFSTGKVTLQGKAFFTFYLRGENLSPVAYPISLTLTAHNKVTNLWQYWTDTAIYGASMNPDGYTAVTLPLNVSLTPETYSYLSVLIRMPAAPAGVKMALCFDKLEIRTQAITSPLITEVKATKIRYLPGDAAGVTVKVINPTATDFTGLLAGEERWGLAERRKAFTQPLTLKAGEARELTANWTLGPEEYGREILVGIFDGNTPVDIKSALFSVSTTPRFLSIGGGASERNEYWDWAPGDLADLAPDENIFCSGQGVMFYRSKAGVKQDLAQQKAAGLWPESYVNGTAWGIAGYDLFVRHPDWFIFDANGEVAGYDMNWREKFKQRHTVEFKPE